MANMCCKSSGIIDIKDKVCLVTGGSRGIGKGIASQLAFYGATCYVTGRNIKSLEDLTREVEESGGTGQCIPIECDHSDDEQVKKVFERIDQENDGKLDLLVNNAYSAVTFIYENLNKKFWELPPDAWDIINNVGLRNHYLCATYAARLMVEKRQGLIINISSAAGLKYIYNTPYGIGKAAKDRMAQDCGFELRKYEVAFISLWPALVKTEEMMRFKEEAEQFVPGLNENLQVAESPIYVGRIVAALLSESHADVMKKSGKILITGDIGKAHGITDEDGCVPGHLLQLNTIFAISGYPRLAKYTPNCLRIPLWLARVGEAFSHC